MKSLLDQLADAIQLFNKQNCGAPYQVSLHESYRERLNEELWLPPGTQVVKVYGMEIIWIRDFP